MNPIRRCIACGCAFQASVLGFMRYAVWPLLSFGVVRGVRFVGSVPGAVGAQEIQAPKRIK
jgi:hypothetical protein